MLAASTIGEKYRCPGEPYSISESVHLSRLAAFYSKCRHCPHALGTRSEAQVSEVEFGPSFAAVAPELSPLVFAGEGIRGKYLNEITRVVAAEWAGALARWLWNHKELIQKVPSAELFPENERQCFNDLVESHSPLVLPMSRDEGIRLLAPSGPGFSVVLGHDERPSSPDLAIGVGQALRRMGCEVIDLGLVTRPALLFAVNHLQSAGAILITGAGCDPGWTGLDFIVHRGIPASSPGTLIQIADLILEGYVRPSRRSGLQRPFPAQVPYETGLWKYFHALRPLKIAFACSNHAVQEVFHAIFRKLACRLIPVEIPCRARSVGNDRDPDTVRLSQSIVAARADLGLLVEEDGEQCLVIDDRGAIVPNMELARILVTELELTHSKQIRAAVPAGWAGISRVSQNTIIEEPNREAVTQSMYNCQAAFGADDHGRFWFTESYPTCDAILTLVHLLRALSHSDTPFSEIVRH